MKKMVFGRKFSRNRKSREALFRSLFRAFVVSRKMVTTKAKGQIVAQLFAKYRKMALKADLASQRRFIGDFFNDKNLYALWVKLLSETKDILITPIMPRTGDNAEMVRISLVTKETKKEVEKKEVKKAEIKK